jgi:predicted secreted hydrolase
MLSRACGTSELAFPRDHGRHPDFRTEWWYLSGQVRSDDGAEWAYQFTIFRRALERWTDLALVGMAIASRTIRNMGLFQQALAKMLETQNCRRIKVDGYVGHFAITNIVQQKYVFFERAGTSLFGIAGAREDCLQVWVKGWELRQREKTMHVAAERNDFAIDLELQPLKPPVLHGTQGLSIKGSEAGQASYHYSLASLRTSGTLKWQGRSFPVVGNSLMDREFGTAMLPRTVRGWDWFGLILDNGHEVMLSLIRNADGSIAETSSGTVVFPDGRWQCLAAEHFFVEAAEFWTSSVTGARYAVGWTVRVGRIDLQLDVHAVVKAHELVSATSTAIDYWEGPVSVSGRMFGKSVTGKGHVEMVGYSQPAGGKF